MISITFVKQPKYPSSFYRWLWKNIQKRYLLCLRPAKLTPHVVFLQSMGLSITTRRLYVLLCRYVLSGNLVQMKRHYQVFFPTKMTYSGINVSSLFNLVEFGNMSVRGLMVLTAIKNERERNIHKYWNIYRMLYHPGG